MNRILRITLVSAFIFGFGGACVNKALWASGCCGGEKHSSHQSAEHAEETKAKTEGEKAEAVKDPVCDMEIIDIKKASSKEYKGNLYYFCSEYCKKKFEKDPASFAAEKAPQHDEGEGHKH